MPRPGALVTAADLFEDRFASRGLSRLYALFQVVVACVFLGFGNYVAYKIASSHGFAEGDEAVEGEFLAGWIACARELAVFLAPNVNSYKRYVDGSFAPTRRRATRRAGSAL